MIRPVMTPASAARRAAAERIAPVYAANPKVAAVILAGSTARGHADRFSDIELGVFWHEPPTDDERLAAIEQAGGELETVYPLEDDAWYDDWKLGRHGGVPLRSDRRTTRRAGRRAFAGMHVMTHAEAAAEIADEQSAGDGEQDDENTDDARGFAIADRDRRQFERHK